VHHCRGIDGLAHAQRWFEAHLVGRRDRRFIQAVTQAANHAIHMQRSVGSETHFQQNFAFEFHVAGIVGIDRLRLVCDFDRYGRRTRFKLREFGPAVHHLLSPESSGCDSSTTTAAIALASGGDAVAEIALAIVPLMPFDPPDPLPCPGPTGMSNPPACAAYSLAPCLPVPFRPLGSPKPPVWTFSTAAFTVGATELPEKSPVCKSCGRAPPEVILICGAANVLITTFGASTGSGVAPCGVPHAVQPI